MAQIAMWLENCVAVDCKATDRVVEDEGIPNVVDDGCSIK